MFEMLEILSTIRKDALEMGGQYVIKILREETQNTAFTDFDRARGYCDAKMEMEGVRSVTLFQKERETGKMRVVDRWNHDKDFRDGFIAGLLDEISFQVDAAIADDVKRIVDEYCEEFFFVEADPYGDD